MKTEIDISRHAFSGTTRRAATPPATYRELQRDIFGADYANRKNTRYAMTSDAITTNTLKLQCQVLSMSAAQRNNGANIIFNYRHTAYSPCLQVFAYAPR